MKRKNFIIGTVSFAAISAVFVLTPYFGNKEGEYSMQELNVFQKQNASDARAWLDARYLDLETGEKITPEKLNQIMQQEKNRKRSNFTFVELGPDNIGGRTRAIHVDRNDPNKIWAGGVSGGLFYSADRANNWARVDEFPGAPYISSMTQTEDGTIFVATGSNEEGWSGDGLHYKTAGSTTWAKVPGTQSMSLITEVVAPDAGNTVFIATINGLKKWTVGDAAMSSVQVATANGGCDALKISRDGQVIVVSMGGTGKTFVSNNGGTSFTDVSGSTAGKVPAGAPRIEYAISPTKNSQNMYSLYVSRTSGNLLGMNVSHDNGQTWSQFVGASGSPSNLDIYRDQGTYNSILTVMPNDPEKILIGGIDIWQWKQTVNNPPSGGFEQLSQWFLDPTERKYVHADNHEMKWDSNNRLYFGNDGGIQYTDDYGQNFFPANRGYNVTQFYGIAMDKYGAVMGGAQDNGTLYNDFSNASYKEFTELGGGDGFECEISFFNPSVLFGSIYNNGISRSGDKGQSYFSFEPPFPSSYGPTGTDGGVHPFHTEFVLAETYDPNSKDSVSFMPRRNYSPNSTIRVPSLATGDTINYITPIALYFDDTVFADPNLTVTNYKVINSINGNQIDLGQNSYTTIYNAGGAVSPPDVGDTLLVNGTTTVAVESVETYQHYFGKNPATNEILDMREDATALNVSWDTVRVADPYQSWFMVYTGANGGEIWGTRDALRLADASPTWSIVATGLGFGSVDIEFSRDLAHCFVSCGSKVYRIDGLDDIYSSQANFDALAVAAGTAKVTVSNASCEGIALNPNNPNDLILLQGFGGTISRSSNATSASPSFTNLTNLGVGAYDAIIDRDDSDIIVVGTALGVKVSTNGGGTWEDASAGFEDVPVYEVRQNWRTWAEGCTRSGEIYLGTFGRGIWASSTLLGLQDKNDPELVQLKTKLKIYPNPTTDVSVISFNLIKTSNVTVRVFNISGQLVKTIEMKNLEKGSQTIDLDASNLPNGSYIVKFNAGTQEETTKFIKL